MKAWPDFNPEKYLDPHTLRNLRRVKENKLQQDFDFVLLIVQKDIGNRMGKSQLGLLASCVMDDNFDLSRVFFVEDDYWRVKPKLLSQASLDFDEAVNIFWSRESGEREKRIIFKEFLLNPSNNFFSVIIIPSLALLQKDFRNIKVNCIWVIDRRGTFASYSRKTGKIDQIKIDPQNKRVTYPSRPDFRGYWKDISKTSIWKDYMPKKKKYISKTGPLNVNVTKATDRVEKMMEDSYTMQDIAKICHVTVSTVYRWIKVFKIFRKTDMLIDFGGRTRIRRSGFEAGMRKLGILRKKWKEQMKHYKHHVKK